jgi:hypothetical protein
VALAALCAALALPLPGRADDGDDVRREGTCTRSSSIELRLRSDDDRIRVELEIEPARRGRWSVILLHERRIAYRGTMRGSGESIEVRRTVPDWFGSDAFVVRATGPRSETCRVTATL